MNHKALRNCVLQNKMWRNAKIGNKTASSPFGEITASSLVQLLFFGAVIFV
jgi:hypothetical protein